MIKEESGQIERTQSHVKEIVSAVTKVKQLKHGYRKEGGSVSQSKVDENILTINCKKISYIIKS